MSDSERERETESIKTSTQSLRTDAHRRTVHTSLSYTHREEERRKGGGREGRGEGTEDEEEV